MNISVPDGIPDPIKCKLFRTQEHFRELQTETDRYYKSHPAKLVRQANTPSDVFIGCVEASAPVPKRIPLILGDFFQNLRSCLDYLVWELVIANKQVPDHKNMFPICTSQDAFRDQLSRGRLHDIPPAAITEIEALQPHHCGQDAKATVLYLIDDFTNINKHRRVLLTNFGGGTTPPDFLTYEIDGQKLASVSFDSISKHDAKIGPFPIVDGALGPGPKVDVPLNLISYISMGEGTAQGVEIGVTAKICFGYVIETLSQFERFFI